MLSVYRQWWDECSCAERYGACNFHPSRCDILATRLMTFLPVTLQSGLTEVRTGVLAVQMGIEISACVLAVLKGIKHH
jgi:hypothetical protein